MRPRVAVVVLSALLLGLPGCAGPAPSAPPPSPHEEARTPHFAFTFKNRCVTAAERDALAKEAEFAFHRISRRLGKAMRPGDFGSGPRARWSAGPPDPELDPAALKPIPIVVADRAGRCYTHAGGIELVKDHLSRHDLTHELVHFLAGSSWSPIDEGLAVWLTEEIHGPDKEAGVHLRTIVYRDLAMLMPLIPARFRDKPMSRVDYDAAASFVCWLSQTFGFERVLVLYNGKERNYHGAFGCSENELFRRWMTWLKSLKLARSREYYRFRARITVGLQSAGPPLSQLRAEGRLPPDGETRRTPR